MSAALVTSRPVRPMPRITAVSVLPVRSYVTRRVVERMAEQPAPDESATARLDELTPREREVLGLVGRGLSNGEIAEALVIEESTVTTHLKRLLAKLDARDRVQAVIFAHENGVVP